MDERKGKIMLAFAILSVESKPSEHAIMSNVAINRTFDIYKMTSEMSENEFECLLAKRLEKMGIPSYMDYSQSGLSPFKNHEIVLWSQSGLPDQSEDLVPGKAWVTCSVFLECGDNITNIEASEKIRTALHNERFLGERIGHFQIHDGFENFEDFETLSQNMIDATIEKYQFDLCAKAPIKHMKRKI